MVCLGDAGGTKEAVKAAPKKAAKVVGATRSRARTVVNRTMVKRSLQELLQVAGESQEQKRFRKIGYELLERR